MTPARRAGGLGVAMLARLFRPLDGHAWLASATVVFCAVIGLTTFHLWQQHGNKIVSNPRYRLKTDRLEVTPQPDWIRSDVVQNAITYGHLYNANLLDPELHLRVRQAFGVQPWVKKVLRINKKFPSALEVDLEYRQPVAMVFVPKGTFVDHDYDGLIPVDDEGCMLPTEMNKSEGDLYPKIFGIDSFPAGMAGNPWGDPRVAEAAQIVTLLSSAWEKLELWAIQVPKVQSPIEGPVDKNYYLITKKQRRIPWGPAPGKEAPGSPSAVEKARLFKTYGEQRGALDSFDQPEVNVSSLKRSLLR